MIKILTDASIFMQFPIVLGLAFLSLKASRIFESRGTFYISIGWYFNLTYLMLTTILKFQTYDIDLLSYFEDKLLINLLDIISSFFFLIGSTKTKMFSWVKRSHVVFFIIGATLLVAISSYIEYIDHKTFYIELIYDTIALIAMSLFFFREIDSLKFNFIMLGSILYVVTQLFSVIKFNHEWGFFVALFAKSMMLYGLHSVFLIRAEEKVNFKKVSKVLDDLIGSTFHEIAKPMGQMEHDLGFVFASEKNKSNIGELVKRVDSINRSYQRMSAIFIASLNLYEEKTSKSLDWQIYSKKERVKTIKSLNFIVEQAYLNSRANRAKTVTFTHEYVGNANILCNSFEVLEAITNIINNAIDAVDAFSGQILIRTRGVYSGHDRQVVLEIIDNGHGIPQNLIGKITDIGVTTKQGAGHGFGLHVAKNLIESNKGQLDFESPHISEINSDPISGTIVRVRFNKFRKPKESANVESSDPVE
jgi:signal transduction histidine kinase